MSAPPQSYGAPSPPSNPDKRPLPEGWITQFDSKYVSELNRNPSNILRPPLAIRHGKAQSKSFKESGPQKYQVLR